MSEELPVPEEVDLINTVLLKELLLR